jgi:release factor glutamine methyltransferase
LPGLITGIYPTVSGRAGSSGRRKGPTDVLMLCPPGTYRAQDDTELLIDIMRQTDRVAGRHVLDVCTGPGTVALAAARQGAASVTAVELSRRSAAAARVNARLHGAAVAVLRGDLFAPVAGSRYDLITANPPYVPSPSSRPARFRAARCWDGGLDGRAVLDRLCDSAGRHLTPDGQVLVVHSAVCDPQLTVDRFARAGVTAEVLERARIPYGPVMRRRAALLEARGLAEAGCETEEIVVIGGRRAG